LVFNRKLQSTSFSYGDSDVTIPPATHSPIDNPLSFSCPFASCTVAAEMSVQFGGNSTAGNDSSLCATLDGNYMQPECPYTGEILTDGRYQEESFTFVQSGVSKGNHTLQGIAWADDGATLGNYTIIYRLYTP
jgi:hypothetical protein